MDKEIKEILDSMSEHLEENKKDYEEIVIKNGFPGDSIVYEVYYEDLKLLLDYITNLQESEAYYYGQYKDYKSRIEKAIEYMQNHQLVFRLSNKKQIVEWFDEFYKNMSNILGGDKDE